MALSGSCNRCGFCCLNIQFIIPTCQNALEWAKARGIKIVQSNEQFTELRFPQNCKNYSEGSCILHNGEKPETCKEFPFNNIDFWVRHGMNPSLSLGKQCGFKYEE